MTTIKIKRIYEPDDKKDGFRVLVDRLWPRGLKKQDVVFDEWIKDIAPSPELRKWFNHDPDKWQQFRKAYETELESSPKTEAFLDLVQQQPRTTLLYAAKDETHNHAIVLQEYVEDQLKKING